jgi:hypothetical protein
VMLVTKPSLGTLLSSGAVRPGKPAILG